MNQAKQFYLSLFIILILLPNCALLAQKAKPTIQDFKVSGDFIKKTDNALVQLDSGFVYYNNDLNLFFNHTIRIQVLKPAGKEWARFNLPYTSADSLIKVEAKLWRLQGDKMLERTFAQSALKITSNADNSMQAAINIDDVEVGDIIEHTYSIKFGDWKNINKWYFQNDIPVLKSSYTTKIPSFVFFYKFLEGVRGLDDIKRSITKDSINGENYNMQFETFVMDSLPAYQEEQDVPGSEYFISKLTYHLAEYTLPGQPTKFLLPESYIELAFNWASDPYFNQISSRATYLQEKINQLYHKSFSDEKNVQSFYFFIRNNFELDNSLYDDDLKATFDRRAGNAQQINMVLAKMLNQAGFNAFLVGLSTVDNRPVYPEFPYFELFNKFVVLVRTPNQSYFLDASDKNLLFNMLAPNSINNGGLVISKSSTGLGSLDYLFDDREEIEASFKITDSATVAGTYKVKRDGYSVYSFDSQFLTDFRSYNDYLIETVFEHPEWNIIKHDVQDMFSGNKEINEALTFSRPFDKVVDGSYYINPVFENEFKINPFPPIDRQNPITLYTPISRKASYKYEIPKGYRISQIPEAHAVTMDDFNSSFKYQVTRNGNTIRIDFILDIDKVIYMADEYSVLSGFFERVTEALNQPIILQKN